MKTEEPVPQTVTILEDSYPTLIDVDGRALRLKIKRLEMDEYTAFMRDWSRCGRFAKKDEAFMNKHRQPVKDKSTGEVLREPMIVKRPKLDAAGREQKDQFGATVTEFVVKRAEPGADGTEGAIVTVPVMEDDATVLARLDLEQTDEEIEAREKKSLEEEAFSGQFLSMAIKTYVTVEPGQLATSNAPITTGDQILRFYAARHDVLQAVLSEIYTTNCLSDDAKKKLALRRAFDRGLLTVNQTAVGAEPAPIAESASLTDSVNLDHATGR